MEIGSIVRFSSDARSFVIEETYCENPDCACNEVSLTFTRIDYPEARTSKPLSFRIRVNLNTWQETDAPPRSQRIGRWVEEFLREFSEARKGEFKAKHDEKKRQARQIAEYEIDPHNVLDGTLISFTDVLTANQSLSSGGRSYTHRFNHDGHEYLVEDMYCANPHCDCQSVHLRFWERNRERDDSVIIMTTFVGKITFPDQFKVDKTERLESSDAQRILSAWWQSHREDIDLYQRRYQRIKELGTRSLAKSGNDLNRSTKTRPVATTRVTNPRPRLYSDAVPTKHIGRNDLCPCGSGKKFKRCCARLPNLKD